MRKIFVVIICIILSACNMTKIDTNTHNAWNPKKNTDCTEFNTIKIFQTFDDFALANVCDRGDTRYCSGMTVVIPKKWGLKFWDDKVITPPNGKCFTYDGIYKYKTKLNDLKTVPIVGFSYEYTPKSEEEARFRFEEMSTEVYKDCYIRFEQEKDKKLKTEGNKFCKCIEDITQETLSSYIPGEDFEQFAKKYFTKAQECAKAHPNASKKA